MSTNPEGALGKRRRSGSTSQQIRDRISAQLELEVDLKLRTIEAAEAKLQWAQAMQDALVESVSRGGGAGENSYVEAFHDEAVQVLDAISLLDPVRRFTETNAPTHRERSRSPFPYGAPLHNPASPNDNEMLNEPSFSPSADTEVITHHTKPLFIQRPSPSAGDGQSHLDVMLISCEICHRSDFTSLHSLLSHARMSHSIFYKTHEELIARCGRLISSSVEAVYIRRHGKEMSANVRVGMRGVIEEGVKYEEESGSGLGLHSESAGVGEILRGNETRKRREIRVFEPDEELDIMGESGGRFFSAARLRPRSRPKNTQNLLGNPAEEWETLLGDIDIFAEVKSNDARDAPLESVTASRFHAKRRVVITDSSHYMLDDQRIDVSRPYQWMIGLSAPSYSEHISTFASKLTVTPMKARPELNPSEPIAEITATQPPFAVVGLASEPFMARIRVDWVGGVSKPLEVEHWVRMDASKVNRTRVGDTQMIDVELDRNTPFLAEPESASTIRLPVLSLLRPQEPDSEQTGLVETSSSVGLSEKDAMQIDSPEHKPGLESEGPSNGSEGINLLEPALRRWAAKLPLTSQDLRARTKDGKLVNYPLPRSAKEFAQLETGRRKAYEWRHAMSLRAALQKNVNSDETLRLFPELFKSLTTGSIYRWLDEQQPPMFPRPPAPNPASFYTSSSNSDTADYHRTFCRYCGLPLARHPMELGESGVPIEERIEGVVYDEPGWRPILCKEAEGLDGVARPPSIDLSSFPAKKDHDSALSHPLASATHASALLSQFRNDLLRWTDPALVRWMDKLVSKWSLPAFATLHQPDPLAPSLSSLYDISTFARRRIDADRESTVPLALLAQVTRVLVKELIGRGVVAARRMAGDVEARRQARNGTERVEEMMGDERNMPLQVLTPSHILHGLEGAERKTRLLKLAVGRFSGHDSIVKSEPDPES